MDELEGKVAVVTGAASGIGLALATRLAAEGMQLVLGDVEAPALDAAASALRDGGAEVEAVVTDVSVAGDVDALGRAAIDRFGALHLAVNNAGVSGGGLSWEIPLETWDWILGVNLRGVIHGLRAFVPRIIESGGGHVVNTASMAGLTSPPFMGPYNVSKHGVVTLSETLYQELQLTHPEVGVTVVCPGWVRTRIHEADRNRPPASRVVPDGQEGAAGLRDIVTSLIEGGLDPAEVADMVVAAVRSGSLLRPHPRRLGGDGADPDGADRVGREPEIALPPRPTADCRLGVTRRCRRAFVGSAPMLLSRSCPVCHRIGPAPCADCVARLVPPPRLAPPPGLDRCVALFAYDDVGAELVAALKFANHRDAVGALGAALGCLVGDGHDVVTWVPASAARRRRNGFDHGEVLARAVAASIGSPCRRLLRRTDSADRGPDRAQPGRAARRAAPRRLVAPTDGVTRRGCSSSTTSGRRARRCAPPRPSLGRTGPARSCGATLAATPERSR